MPRSRPSVADLDLIARVAAEGVSVSPAQLERWRARGLVPRSEHQGLGRGRGSTSTHPGDLTGLAYDLGQLSQRKMPWQQLTVELFELGWPLDDKLLRVGATWLVDRAGRRMRTLVSGLRQAGLLTDDELDKPHPEQAVAAAIAQYHRHTHFLRPALRTARKRARRDHPEASRNELAELVTDYFTAELEERLGDDIIAAVASRHEQVEPSAGQGPPGRTWSRVSPRTMRPCAETLTEDEVALVREPTEVLYAEAASKLATELPGENAHDYFSTLYLCLCMVAEVRLQVHDDPGRPVYLNDLEAYARRRTQTRRGPTAAHA